MSNYNYRVTVAFGSANWPIIAKAIFGTAQHDYSQTCDSEPVATYGFSTPQTPADLGPLVKVELITI